MFYQLQKPVTLGEGCPFLDISRHLHRFLQAEQLSADILFRTSDPEYPPLLGVYFKESLLPDGKIGLLYEGRNIDIRFLKFSPEWLLEGMDLPE